MTQVWALAAVWIGLSLVATLLAIVFRISTALSEIVIGTVAQLVIGAFVGTAALGAKAPWITFSPGTGAIVLTFLAGAELDPEVFRSKFKEASISAWPPLSHPRSVLRHEVPLRRKRSQELPPTTEK